MSLPYYIDDPLVPHQHRLDASPEYLDALDYAGQASAEDAR